jgi:hypothetical protein
MQKMLPQAMPDTRELLLSARAIFAICTDREQPLTVANIAIQSGMTEEAVVEVLNSPQYLEAMTREFRAVSGMAMRRGLARMTEIVDGGGDRESIAAYRAIVDTYKVAVGTEDPRDQGELLGRLWHKAKSLDQLNNTKDAEATKR